MTYQHTPVLLDEVLEYLNLKINGNYIDCTLGLGGHAKEILEKISPKGKLLGIEQNNEGLNKAKKNLSKYENNTILVNDNFRNLDQIARSKSFTRVSGILFDLGLASWQIDNANIGISFQKDEPLDMRLENINNQSPITKRLTAADVVNKYPLKKLADTLYQYSDIRNSYQMAKKIIRFREKSPITTTFNLKEALQTNNPRILAPIFQVLRIEVNQELINLSQAIEDAVGLLDQGGRLVVISYHSGEDRIIKNFFRNNDQLKIITKKPIIPSQEEINYNSRARSAKMRVAEKGDKCY